MINANEEIGSTPGGLGQIMAANGLYDILANQHDAKEYPNTYIRGTKRIDYIFGTAQVLKHCKSSGLLPFCYGYPSDHRAAFIRIDLASLMSSQIHAAESMASRLIHSATPKEREQFLDELDQHYENQNLYERLHKLWTTPVSEWNVQQEEEYNNCDKQHIAGMLAAERKTCKVKKYAWSPTYSSAVEDKNFWKTILMLKRNHAKPHHKITAWAETKGITDIGSLHITQINAQLRAAQKHLREILLETNQLRENHLRELLAITRNHGDDKQHEKRLQILIRAHKKQHSYRKIQAVLKPRQRSGLSHILVPEDANPNTYPYDPEKVTAWKMIYDHRQLQEYLLKRNANHFGQAHGTPFTIPPLTGIDWMATSEQASELLRHRRIHPELKQQNP
jgi:hypothetical protein